MTYRFKRFFACAALALAIPKNAMAQVANVDPQGSGPIVNALSWIQGTLLGNVATTAAVIAVAVVGLMMLTGRMNWRLVRPSSLAASFSLVPQRLSRVFVSLQLAVKA